MVLSNSISQPDSHKASGLFRAFRGARSLLAGLAFPLGGWWTGEQTALRTDRRLQNGCILVLPGVEAKGSLNAHIALGLVDGGVSSAVEIHDWTTGFWPLFAYHLRHEGRSRGQAAACSSQISIIS